MLLWLLRILYYLNVLHWLCLGVHMKKERQIETKRAPDQIGPPVRTTKRNIYNFWFSEDMRAHEYSLEILLSLLSNPGNLTSFRPSNNKVIIKRLKTGQKVKSLLEDLSLLKFQCKTVPFYNVSWCIRHIAGNLVKSSFTPNKRLIVSTSEQGVMIRLLKIAPKLKGCM